MEELVESWTDMRPADQFAQEHEQRHRQQDVVDPHPPELELGGHQRGLKCLDLPQEGSEAAASAKGMGRPIAISRMRSPRRPRPTSYHSIAHISSAGVTATRANRNVA